MLLVQLLVTDPTSWVETCVSEKGSRGTLKMRIHSHGRGSKSKYFIEDQEYSLTLYMSTFKVHIINLKRRTRAWRAKPDGTIPLPASPQPSP